MLDHVRFDWDRQARMKKRSLDFDNLSRREREVMYSIHRVGEVSADQLSCEMGGDFSGAAARRYLSILHNKGYLRLRRDGGRCYYRAVRDRRDVGLELLRTTFRNFFGGSAAVGMASFLRKEKSGDDIEDELRDLEQLLRDHRERKSV